MSEILCHHNGKYNFYSTIADGFIYERGLTLDEVNLITNTFYGEIGSLNLSKRLERAHKNGHSALSGESLEEFLCSNRAGDNEKELTYQECIDRFLS